MQFAARIVLISLAEADLTWQQSIDRFADD
jgi:hypothetical protein